MNQVLLSVEILLAILLDQKTIGNINEYTQFVKNNLDAIEELKEVINQGNQLHVYVPPCAIHSIENIMMGNFGKENYTFIRKKLNELLTKVHDGNFLPLNHNDIYIRANSINILSKFPGNIRLLDTSYLLYAQQLKVDAIVAYEPSRFKSLLERMNSHESQLSGFKIDIYKLKEFIDLVKSKRVKKNEIILIHTIANNEQITLHHNPDKSEGVTPIDFAYALDENLGHSCSKAYVNGIEVPLNHLLKTGDSIKIEAEGKAPNKDWLEFVGTQTAAIKIDNYFKDQSILRGWQKVSEALGINNVQNDQGIIKSLSIISRRNTFDKLDIMIGYMGSENTRDIEKINELLGEINGLRVNIQKGWENLTNKMDGNIDRNSKNLLNVAKQMNYNSVNELLLILSSEREKLDLAIRLLRENNNNKVENQSQVRRVVVYSPNYDQKILFHTEESEGVTPIDFAYALHEHIGHQCSKAYVNGIEVPLNYCLETGDVVNLKKEGKNPQKEWSKFVGTRRARKKIEHWFSYQEINKGYKKIEEYCDLETKSNSDGRFPPEIMKILRDISNNNDYGNVEKMIRDLGSNDPEDPGKDEP